MLDVLGDIGRIERLGRGASGQEDARAEQPLASIVVQFKGAKGEQVGHASPDAEVIGISGGKQFGVGDILIADIGNEFVQVGLIAGNALRARISGESAHDVGGRMRQAPAKERAHLVSLAAQAIAWR